MFWVCSTINNYSKDFEIDTFISLFSCALHSLMDLGAIFVELMIFLSYIICATIHMLKKRFLYENIFACMYTKINICLFY
jgi:hypothetical protein